MLYAVIRVPRADAWSERRLADDSQLGQAGWGPLRPRFPAVTSDDIDGDRLLMRGNSHPKLLGIGEHFPHIVNRFRPLLGDNRLRVFHRNVDDADRHALRPVGAHLPFGFAFREAVGQKPERLAARTESQRPPHAPLAKRRGQPNSDAFPVPRLQFIMKAHPVALDGGAGEPSGQPVPAGDGCSGGRLCPPRDDRRISPQQFTVGLGDKRPFGVGVLGAIQVEFAVPDGVRAELLRVEGKPDATQRDDDAPRRVGHRRVAEKLPWRVMGRLGLLRLAKRLRGGGKAKCAYEINKSQNHCG